MLEQLIESKSNSKENKTRGGFIATTFLLVTALCFSAVLSSLFAMNLGIGGEDLELTSLVMPIAAEKPEPVEPVEKQENKTTEKVVAETTRQTNTLRLEENPLVPNQISVVPNTQKERPKGSFVISNKAETTASAPNSFKRETNENETGGVRIEPKIKDDEKEEAPDLKKATVAETKKPAVLRSGGVVNGQATSLPKPAYPAAAKAVGASGAVNVQVLIDENGKVVSAKAVTGHPLLRGAAETAARNARFTPTILTNQPVKVSGVIIYNFTK